MLNHIILMGSLTHNPELSSTENGVAVASFTLAVDRDFAAAGAEKETDFIDIVAWRNTAEFVSKYFTKGRMAVVCGRLQIRNWNDKEGNKRRSAEVIAENVYFGDSKRDSADGSYGNASYGGSSYGNAPAYGSAPAANAYSAPAAPAPASDFSMIEDDDSQLPI